MKISEHCYIISGLSVEPPWSVNSGFIVGGHSTLIVDTGSNYLSAQTIYGYASCVKPDNKLIVINTEPHFDHIGGNCFFREKNIDIFAFGRIVAEHPYKRSIKKQGQIDCMFEFIHVWLEGLVEFARHADLIERTEGGR